MATTTALPTAELTKEVHEYKTQSKAQPPYNDPYMIVTFIIFSSIALGIYIVTDYVWLEKPTRDIARMLLSFVGIENHNAPGTIEDFLRGEGIFYEAVDETPGIFIPTTNTKYWIVKACTGMQAGALMLGLIAISHAKWTRKVIASIIFFMTLFIGNTLRIAFHLLLTYILHLYFGLAPQEAFYWGHDVTSKIIGFFGTLFFAWLIEQMGVPVIDTFADYVDYVLWRLSWIYHKVTNKT